jgi:hypothetical protein
VKRLGWLGCCVAAFVFAGSAVAVGAPPPTLTGEQFRLVGAAGGGCNAGTASFSFDGSGAAIGPYAGTFTESGEFTVAAQKVTAFSSSFTIFSPAHDVLVKGTTTRDPAAPPFAACIQPPNKHYLFNVGTTYVATIFTPTGNYRDQGGSVANPGAGDSGSLSFLLRAFTSSLAAPTLIVPTTKRQCKRGGWRDYPQFKNQGRCVRFVVTGKGTPPSGSKAHGHGKKPAKSPK